MNLLYCMEVGLNEKARPRVTGSRRRPAVGTNGQCLAVWGGGIRSFPKPDPVDNGVVKCRGLVPFWLGRVSDEEVRIASINLVEDVRRGRCQICVIKRLPLGEGCDRCCLDIGKCDYVL